MIDELTQAHNERFLFDWFELTEVQVNIKREIALFNQWISDERDTLRVWISDLNKSLRIIFVQRDNRNSLDDLHEIIKIIEKENINKKWWCW